MKIIIEFEYPHELTNLLKELGSNLKQDEPVKTEYCSFAGTEHDKCDHFICMEDCK